MSSRFRASESIIASVIRAECPWLSVIILFMLLTLTWSMCAPSVRPTVSVHKSSKSPPFTPRAIGSGPAFADLRYWARPASLKYVAAIRQKWSICASILRNCGIRHINSTLRASRCALSQRELSELPPGAGTVRAPLARSVTISISGIVLLRIKILRPVLSPNQRVRSRFFRPLNIAAGTGSAPPQ